MEDDVQRQGNILHFVLIKIMEKIAEFSFYYLMFSSYFFESDNWMSILQLQICHQRHTWQSLREHYKKQIHPQLKLFNLTEKQLERFRRSMKGLPVSKLVMYSRLSVITDMLGTGRFCSLWLLFNICNPWRLRGHSNITWHFFGLF